VEKRIITARLVSRLSQALDEVGSKFYVGSILLKKCTSFKANRNATFCFELDIVILDENIFYI